jgi:hypothetical protein
VGDFPREAFISADRATVNAIRNPILRQVPDPRIRLPHAAAEPPPPRPCGWTRTIPGGPGPERLQDEPWFSPGGLQFDYERTLKAGSRYYRGDFHAHTRLSDGANDLVQAGTIARAQGLDFIALTEHNRLASGLPGFKVLPIPSYELTLPLGHFNIHGLRNPLFTLETLEILKSARSEEECWTTCSTATPGVNRSSTIPFWPWELRYGRLDLAGSIRSRSSATYLSDARRPTTGLRLF